MSTLPNILPTANADSFSDGGAMAFSGPPEKNAMSFDHLMRRALSPSSNEANQPVEQSQLAKNAVSDLEKSGAEAVVGNSSQETKNSKFSAQTSGKTPAKKSNGDSDDKANLPALPEMKAAADPENYLIPIVALTADGKNESNAKTASDTPFAGSKAAITGKPGGVLAALFEAKKISAVDSKIPSAAISQNQPGVETNPAVKADDAGKIAAVEALAVEKTNSADLKTAMPVATSPQVLPLPKEIASDLKTPKPAELFIQPPQGELSAAPDLKEKVTAQAMPEINGTSVAQQEAPMTKTEKPNKTADLAGKILPGAAVSSSQANNLPPRENFSTLAMRAGQIVPTDSASSPGRVTETAQLSADSANSIASAGAADVRLRGLERVQDMVVLHAARLSDSGNSSLQVVIKPGVGTQLSLELRQRGDGVEAQAVLQHGDFEHLKQQWPALQQQLEQRGIRLAPLVADGNFAGNGENNFQQKQNQSAEPDSFPMLAEIAPISFAQPAARAGAHHGWESWA